MAFNKKPKTINPNEVDPAVYYYDEVYDEMKEDKKSPNQAKVNSSTKEGSKYIEGLLQTAELRKSEREVRVFKKYARDREKAKIDGDLDGEDVYISSSYKRKLKEVEILEAKNSERLRLERDNRMNFSKQSDLNEKNASPDETPNEEVSAETSKSGQVSSDSIVERKSKLKLKTTGERRKFLRRLLAKRTVGKTYDEAVERYLERRSVYR